MSRAREVQVPKVSPTDTLLLALSTSKAVDIQQIVLPKGKHGSVQMSDLLRQVASDRFRLASSHLQSADTLLTSFAFRSCISRNYYAMYHAARAVVFGSHVGDDFEPHSVLPRNLPAAMPHRVQRESELTDARLLRNQADYDAYPQSERDWEADARQLGALAPEFVQACEDYALQNGLI